MLRSPRFTLLILAAGIAILSMCQCASSATVVTQRASVQPAESPLAMMESTVFVSVTVASSIGILDKDREFVPVATAVGSWTGAGVVYGKNDRGSLILTAHHVVETPQLGEVLPIDNQGILFERVDAVLMTIKTFDGRICELTPLRFGVADHRDTATAQASCNAGRIAKIATSSPVRGSKVFVVGHPASLDLPIVTEGYVAGYKDGYVYLSAPVYGGNSGGPVFYNGEVVGLLVRANTRYHHISLMTSLEQLLLRIAETG